MAYQMVSGAVTGATGAATGALARAKERATEHTTQLREAINEKREKVDLQALRDAGYGVRKDASDRYAKVKLNGQGALFDLSVPVRARVLVGLRESIKSVAVADPDMCECVRSRVEGLVDLFWDDLTVYIDNTMRDSRAAAMGHAVTDVEELAKRGEDDAPTMCSPRWWRAKILYHYLPFDISIFGQVKDPWFWILTVISLIPLYGIRVAFFSLILVLMLLGMPADEYQLVGYIIGFKGTQFISSGVVQAIGAAVRYYLCVHPGGEHTCDTTGPGANQDMLSGVIDFVGSCILVWVAFLCLPCSERSAGMRELEVDTEGQDVESPGCCSCCQGYDREKGGRLRGLLGYDMFCFLLSCLLALGLMYVDVTHARPGGPPYREASFSDVLEDVDTWTGHAAIYWARILYSFLSFPFIIFLIPGVNGILTHTSPTGYNEYGYCLPFTMHPMPKAKTK
mmetsp:Transcript_63397/g.163120  ORF Transcript_63397/g.163120 Transcript_63397/m.163120 type:complete len:453 (-) Transcript_63397:87-1445(-)